MPPVTTRIIFSETLLVIRKQINDSNAPHSIATNTGSTLYILDGLLTPVLLVG